MPKRNSINEDTDRIPLIERIPHVNKFCLCFGLRFGSLFIGISGIVLGCMSFLAYLLLVGRSELDFVTVLLLLLLSLFALVTIVFIIGSVLLVLSTCCRKTICLLICSISKKLLRYVIDLGSPDFMPAYIWIVIIYWITQMVLGIFIPIVLILDGGKSFFIGLVWSCLVMTLGLIWTHYLAVVKSYMWRLYNVDAY